MIWLVDGGDVAEIERFERDFVLPIGQGLDHWRDVGGSQMTLVPQIWSRDKFLHAHTLRYGLPKLSGRVVSNPIHKFRNVHDT